jgi:hypothetical protein
MPQIRCRMQLDALLSLALPSVELRASIVVSVVAPSVRWNAPLLSQRGVRDGLTRPERAEAERIESIELFCGDERRVLGADARVPLTGFGASA